MDIWVIDTFNQLFITGPYTQIKYSTKQFYIEILRFQL